MKTDLATAIGAAVFGVIASYFICNLFISPLEDVTVKTVDPNLHMNLVDPSNEVFNYRALNPTVEVYVGNCTEFNSQGECIDSSEEEEVIEEWNIIQEGENTTEEETIEETEIREEPVTNRDNT